MTSKEILKIATSEKATYILEQMKEIQESIKAKCYTIYEEEVKRGMLKAYIKQLKDILKEE